MKTTVAATLVLAVLALGASALFWQKSRADTREAALRRELARLGQRVDAVDSLQQSAMTRAMLERAGRGNTVVVGLASAAASAGDASLAPPPTADPETLDERKAKAAEHRTARARALDDYLSTDRIDKPWTDAMVAAAYRVVDATKTAHLLKTDCASHLCRIVVDHSDVNEQRAFAASVSQEPPFDNGIFFRYDTSLPRPQTTLYVAREGTELATVIPSP
jgi:hypothetical protein